LMEIERLRRQKQVTEETLLRDKEKGLQDMQRVLKETENRAREAEEGKKKTEDSLRFFTQQHHEKVKELEQRFAEQKDTAEKKEWYLGEARADLERARGALERAEKDLETAKKDLENAKNQSEEVQAELRDMRHAKDAAVSAATAAQKIIAERDSALDASGEECRGELAEARKALEAVAEEVEKKSSASKKETVATATDSDSATDSKAYTIEELESAALEALEDDSSGARSEDSGEKKTYTISGGGGSFGSEKTTTTRPQPYGGFVPKEVREELVVKLPTPGEIDSIDENQWIPQTETVSFFPLLLNVTQGYYVNLLRVKGSGVLSRHRHSAPVHGFVLKGSWRYLEHEWVAERGSYVFEPPGETHTLVVPEGVDEMITVFNVTGALLYCDEDGNVTGAEDVFDKLAMAKKHYEKIGWGAEYANQFVR